MAKVITKKVNKTVGVEFAFKDLLDKTDLYNFFRELDVDFEYDPEWCEDDSDFYAQFELKVGKETIPLDKLKIKFIDVTRTGEA